MRICVVGAGYVGLATGVMFGKLGHDVVCTDVDPKRVRTVNEGRLPFHEPPLERELRRLVRKGSLRATRDTVGSAAESDVTFICVQTPSRPSGKIDVGPVRKASKDIGRALRMAKGYKVVVIKSTVVPSTTDSVVKPILERLSGKSSTKDFGLCMNPEFLQEGNALKDSMEPSRVVIGSEDRRAGKLLMDMYRPIRAPKLSMDLRSAEMVKYASNVFLATKITYANDIANMCVRFGIDSEQVLRAAGLDPRIGPLFLRPGLGFGGSCLPKDVRALIDRGRSEGYSSKLLSSILAVNESQPTEGIFMLEMELGDLRGKRIAVLGLSFKGGVDDIRDTRAIPLITGLLARGARVVAFDPMAMDEFIHVMPTIGYAASASECLEGADGCIVQSDWAEFRRLGKKEFSRMRNPVIVDGRRSLDPEKVRRAGARYLGIGYGRTPR